MGKELKLEVGKLYETRDGNVVHIYRISGGRYLGSVRSGGCYEWEKDGSSSGTNYHETDIIRCLDDEPELVDLTKIRKTGLFTVEGEKDDISAPGQTIAAHTICSGIPEDRRHNHLQKGVGHYGIFNGRRWREEIVPEVSRFIREMAD